MEISISLDPAMAEGKLKEYLAQINDLHNVSVHCDVIRESFASGSSVTESEYQYILHNSRHPVDVHVMSDPIILRHVLLRKPCCCSPRSIIIHVETVSTMDALLYFSIIRDAGAKAGIAIDLDTAVESVDRKLLDACDFVLILSVHAGKSGQAFDARALKKAQTVRKMCPNVCLILDGGINASNIDTVRAAGVDVAGVGSFIYNMPTQTQRAQAVAALSGI